jgi:hypothetical protein
MLGSQAHQPGNYRQKENRRRQTADSQPRDGEGFGLAQGKGRDIDDHRNWRAEHEEHSSKECNRRASSRLDQEEQCDYHPRQERQECQAETCSGEIHGIAVLLVRIGIGPAAFSGFGCGEL